ncbi:MAG: Gfo/Idh/MocA family oxidoreductase [Lachnospiraceae bacterium]|nr:Gfo/Idh/MocA family oxidoreductase [Lachnospiraceae bacterium]
MSKNVRVAILGVGNMGGRYAHLLQEGRIQGMELAALTRVRGKVKEDLQPSIDAGVVVYQEAGELLDAVEQGKLALDAVIIATPHTSHEALAVRAFMLGLHVLTDKPAGVYLRQAIHMNQAADESGKVYGMVFNQRTNPVYQQMKAIVESGQYGKLKRVNWVVTDWYRPEKYYSSSSWHARWDTDGGGVLLNQCPHNLDLLQWICKMPVKVQGFCKEGRFHQIEVEDDVTAYLEWENGATGTFITSTGDAPGVNRLEVSLDEAMLICEHGKLRILEIEPEMGMKEAEYMATSEDFFRKFQGTERVMELPGEENPYDVILQSFANAILGTGSLVADGREGYASLLLSNAIYLSSWQQRMVELPAMETAEETRFNQEFEAILEEKKSHKVK